eukprot:504124_1
MATKNTFMALVTVNKCFTFSIASFFLFMIVLSKLKHGQKVKRLYTILFYIVFYEFAALLDFLDTIGNNYDLYETDGVWDNFFDICKISSIIISHELFFIIMIERLYYPFKNTQHVASSRTLTSLILISIIIESIHFFVRILINYEMFSSMHLPLLIIFLFSSVSFGLNLAYMFVKKLFQVIKSSRTSFNHSPLLNSTPSVQYKQLSKMPLNPYQTIIIKAITRNVVLNVLAILFRNMDSILYVIERVAMHKWEHNNHNKRYTIIPIIQALYNICLFLQLSNVYLSYSYFICSGQCYDKLCNKMHFIVNKFGVEYTQKKMTDLNMEQLSVLSSKHIDVSDTDDEYQLMDDEY